MPENQFKSYCLIFLFAFGAIAFCSAQNNNKDAININVLIDSFPAG